MTKLEKAAGIEDGPAEPCGAPQRGWDISAALPGL